MNDRLEMSAKIKEALGYLIDNENVKIYFNPPADIKLSYPCVIYTADAIDDTYANDSKYLANRNYSLTVIDRKATSVVAEAIYNNLPFTTLSGGFVKDNLYHQTFRVKQ